MRSSLLVLAAALAAACSGAVPIGGDAGLDGDVEADAGWDAQPDGDADGDAAEDAQPDTDTDTDAEPPCWAAEGTWLYGIGETIDGPLAGPPCRPINLLPLHEVIEVTVEPDTPCNAPIAGTHAFETANHVFTIDWTCAAGLDGPEGCAAIVTVTVVITGMPVCTETVALEVAP